MKNLKELYNQCIQELTDIGIEYGNVSEIVVNKRAKRRWGLCKKLPNKSFRIEISCQLLQDSVSDDACKNTIIHELLHTCEGCQNHGYKWKEKANIVNSNYPQYNIKRTTSEQEKGIDEKDDKKRYPYQFKCEGCGKISKRMKMSKFVKYYKNYRCRACGGKFIPILLNGVKPK